VLDVGCGCGYGTHALALAGAAEVLGVDISPEAIDFAGSRYSHPGLAYRVMDTRALDLQGSYDLITCFELIEHVNEDADVVRSLAAALAEDGICLISTPNSETYVAGGEGGDNPYHCREYRRSEFEGLLGAGFPGVVMLEQRWIDGMLLSPPAPDAETGPGGGAAALLPDDGGIRQAPATFGAAPYFVAVCTSSTATALPEMLKRPFAALTANMRYRKLKEEFDKRGRWARSLDEELRRKDDLLSQLREEKNKLEREFDERGHWAQGLDREIREKDKLIGKLMADNEQLRRTAMLTGK
jgi:SAM-dependent methyltransferase